MAEVDGDEDEFQDAMENIPPIQYMDLDIALDDCRLIENLFFNNKFEEAKQLTKPWAHKSIYHSLALGTISFLQAVMTYDATDFEIANDAVNNAIDVCTRFRKKSTITQSVGKLIKRPNYDTYTDEEVHAELCYAESLLLRAILTFLEDETLMSFVKGAFKIRSCFQSYKDCWHIFQNRTNWSTEKSRMNFESGVRLGVGAYHLLISVLPSKILKVLEFIGFHGNRKYGLRELETGFNLKGSLFHVLCGLALCSYHLMFIHHFVYEDGDLTLAEEIINYQLQQFPQGAWFLFFKGRLSYVRADLEDAITWYKRSWESQSEWTQFHHICFWELCWSHCLLQDWQSAGEYAHKLFENSKWSKTVYAYLKVSMMLMREDELGNKEKEQVNQIMKDLPQWKQRIAGKSLPMEKFAIKKSERYFSQGKKLVLPSLELLYVWNGFKVMGKREKLIQSVLVIIQKEMALLLKHTGDEYHIDNMSLLLVLKGMCLMHLHSPLQAEECFRTVLLQQKKLKDDLYLAPYATVELSILLWNEGEKIKSTSLLSEAKQLMETAKNGYKGYILENRLHFRIHSAQAMWNVDKEDTEYGVEEVTPL